MDEDVFAFRERYTKNIAIFSTIVTDKAFTKPSCNMAQNASNIVMLIMVEVVLVIVTIVALILLASLVHYIRLKIKGLHRRRMQRRKSVQSAKSGMRDAPFVK